MRLSTTGLSAIIALTAAGCFHPAIARHEPEPEKNNVPVAYDLVWDAAITVIKKNELKVQPRIPFTALSRPRAGILRFRMRIAASSAHRLAKYRLSPLTRPRRCITFI